MSKKLARAPYNFVPFPEKIIERYSSYDKLPAHDASNGEKDLLSGEVTFDIVAQSPILVADGTGRDDENNNKPRTFVKDANGKYVIPGSTLRGLMRSTMSVLSMSNWTSRIDDETFYYRMVGESKTKLAKTYRDIVGADTERTHGKISSIARNVDAGYLVKENRNNYVIYPAKTSNGRHGKSYYKYHEGNVNKVFLAEFQNKLRTGFTIEDCTFNVNSNGSAINLYGDDTSFSGKLIFSGPMFGKFAKKSAYVINEIDKEAKPIPITSKQLQMYQADYKFRKSKFDKNKRKTMNDFFNLPEKKGFDGAKPCFYIRQGTNLYFGFTAFLRLTYDQSTTDVLPKRFRNLDLLLDYEKSLFGFTKNDFDNSNKNDNLFNYASRLSFFPSVENDVSNSIIRKNVTLRTPRASALSMYLKQDLNSTDYKSYNDPDTELKGMKQYWIKKNPHEAENGLDKIELLDKGSKFTAKIKFDQLADDELGLLLLALTKPNYHQIGMGKPYGYGTVKFNNINCHILGNKNMYDGLTNLLKDPLEKVDIKPYTKAFLNFVKETTGINLLKEESIKIFLAMKDYSNLNPKQMKYMDVNNYSNEKKLPSAKQLLDNKFVKKVSYPKNESEKKDSKGERLSKRTTNSNQPRERNRNNRRRRRIRRGLPNNPFADLGLDKKFRDRRKK